MSGLMGRRLALIAVAIPAGWIGLAMALSRLPTDGLPPDPTGVDVYVCSNGYHTDLALPARAAGVDWSARLDGACPQTSLTGAYALFGWGDLAFYAETRTLADLRPLTALTALAGLGPSALHVTFLPDRPACVKIALADARYRRLAAFVTATFAFDAAGRTQPLCGRQYGQNDVFFAAKGAYGPIHTCNQWTADGLSAAGLPVGRWTPLAGQVMSWARRP